MGNVFAYVALFSWPVIALSVFAIRKGKARMSNTVAWMLLIPLMFLPSGMAWDPPLLPPFDKFRVALLSIWLALRIFHSKDALRRAPLHNLPRLVFALCLAGIAGTIVTNKDALVYGPVELPALTWYDYLSFSLGEFLDIYLPFSIGQRAFRDEQSVIDFFKVMSTSLLIYAPFMLFEIRMSPQLHMWIYGFYPSMFIQAMRAGGFRPIVFMKHGLSVAAWTFACLVSTLALSRAGANFPRVKTGVRVFIDWVMLILCKSLGPTIYGVIATWLRYASPKAIARFVVVVVLLVTVYPVLRAEDLFPTETLLGWANAVSEDRAQSLGFRFENDDALLKHAMERPWFGWGSFDRNHVYTSWGKRDSITDGQWIITLGTYGYVGYAGYTTLLVMPLLRFLRSYKKMPKRARGLCAMLALLLALFLLDLLPNAFSDYLTLIYAGMLWTVSEVLRRSKKKVKAAKKIEKRSTSTELAMGTDKPAVAPASGPLPQR